MSRRGIFVKLREDRFKRRDRQWYVNRLINRSVQNAERIHAGNNAPNQLKQIFVKAPGLTLKQLKRERRRFARGKKKMFKPIPMKDLNFAELFMYPPNFIQGMNNLLYYQQQSWNPSQPGIRGYFA